MKLTAYVAVLFLSLSAVACSAGEPARPGAASLGNDSTSSARGANGGSNEDEDRAPNESSTPPANPSSPAAPSAPSSPAFATSAEQVAAGQQTFASVCTRCHGSDGSGARGPRLIGRSDGALGSFTNAEEVAAYVASNMPVASKGEAYAVVAYLMQKNGIEVGERILDESIASTIELR